jgi:hypothetical protein
MGYVVHPDGSITADSIDDAIALSKRLSANKPRPHVSPPPAQRELEPLTPPAPSGSPSRETLGKFAGLLNDNQQKFLRLLKNDGKQSVEALTKSMGFDDPRSLTGVISGVVKNARKAAIHADAIFVRTEEKGVVFYAPGPVFTAAAPSQPGGSA